MKDPVVKFFEHILVSQIKMTVMNNLTPYQIGAKVGHQPQEHLFLMMSMMKQYEIRKKPLIIQLYDISTFFDKELLPDVMNEVFRNGVEGKMYRILYKLNEKRIIKVKTAVGVTEEAEVLDGVDQRTLNGAIVSYSSIDRGMDDNFESSQWEAWYGRI